jgi:hypothetical protein
MIARMVRRLAPALGRQPWQTNPNP